VRVRRSAGLSADPRAAGADVSLPDATRARTSAIVSPRTAILLLALVIILWGVNWPILKWVLRDVPPLTFVSIRLTIGLMTMVAINVARGDLRLPSSKDLPIVLSTGILQIAAGTVLINLALLVVPAGRSAVLFYTTPLWVTPGAVLLLGERLTVAKIGGLAAGLLGLAVLFNPAQFDWTDGRAVLGNGLLLVASVAWAIQMLHVRTHRWHATPLQLLPWQLLVAMAISVPLAVALEGGQSVTLSIGAVAALAFNGFVVVAFCFWAFITINRALPAVTTSLGSLAVPVVGVLVSAVVGGEPLTATMLLGILLIGAGLAVVVVSGATSAGTRQDRLEGTSGPGDLAAIGTRAREAAALVRVARGGAEVGGVSSHGADGATGRASEPGRREG
jgi:drug/metabolite transporter (DMT)-like permease